MAAASKRRVSVTFLRYSGKPTTSDRTLLAVALLTLGVLTHGDEPFVQTMDTVGGQPVFTNLWTFETKSQDKQYKTAELMEWWDDAAWLLAHPEHPLTILRKGLADPAALVASITRSEDPESPYAYLSKGVNNLERVRAELRKVVPLIKVTKGRRSVYIPANATPEQREKLMVILNRS
jgi:hypothetical protein